MSVKISELPLLSTLSDNDVLAGVDTSADTTKKIELSTLKEYTNANIDLTDYVQNTDYASTTTGGVIKIGSYGSNVTNEGVLTGNTYPYSSYSNVNNNAFISKGTLENVITGKGLVSNTNYATDTTGGVIRATTYQGLEVTNAGALKGLVRTYAQYTNTSTTADTSLISKGTLENVLTEKIGDINSVLDTINGEVI